MKLLLSVLCLVVSSQGFAMSENDTIDHLPAGTRFRLLQDIYLPANTASVTYENGVSSLERLSNTSCVLGIRKTDAERVLKFAKNDGCYSSFKIVKASTGYYNDNEGYITLEIIQSKYFNYLRCIFPKNKPISLARLRDILRGHFEIIVPLPTIEEGEGSDNELVQAFAKVTLSISDDNSKKRKVEADDASEITCTTETSRAGSSSSFSLKKFWRKNRK